MNIYRKNKTKTNPLQKKQEQRTKNNKMKSIYGKWKWSKMLKK